MNEEHCDVALKLCVPKRVTQSEGGKVVGILTDGDVRRRLPGDDDPASAVMTYSPLSAPLGATVEDLIKMMTVSRVTCLVIRDDRDALVGIVHMQDCLAFAL